MLDEDLDTAIFASDLAKDVRAEFVERRSYGLSVADATAAVVDAFRHLLDRAEEGPVVIVAVAALQLADGALDATFREAALDLLREGHGFELRAGEQLSSRRDREHLRDQLIQAIDAAPVFTSDVSDDEIA